MQFLIFLSFFTQISQAADPVLLTRTIGTSAFQVVTSREVRANEILNQTMTKELQDSAFDGTIDPTQRVLFEIAIFRESQNLAAVKMDANDVKSLIDNVKPRLQKNSEWKNLDVTDAELKSWVERKKTAYEFLKLKSSTMATIVTDQEIQDYYEKNRVKFGSTPLDSQRSNIRYFLQKENQKTRVQEWLAALKTKYQIRNDLADKTADEKALEKNNSKTQTE